MTGIVAYVLSKKYVKKSLAGLGALRGSSCMIKSIVPHYSALDPAKVVDYDVTFMWDSNNDPDPTHVPDWHEETIQSLDMGRGIYDVVYDPSGSTAESLKYNVRFYDGTTSEFEIPTSSSGMKKKVITKAEKPLPEMADHNTIYLIQDDFKPGVYEQWITVEDNATHAWEWLSLGSTEVNLTDYQPRIDELISRNYPNYDPATKAVKPSAPNVVGAINEFEAELGGHYDFTANKITELNTWHNKNIVEALNEIGDLRNLEMFDAATATPNTLVDAINLANAEYNLDKETVGVSYATTEGKYTLYKIDNTLDPSVKIDKGNVLVPRVGSVQRADTMSATNKNYLSYDIVVGGNYSNPDDPTAKPYGRIDIPHLMLAKIDPPIETVIDAVEPALTAWVDEGTYYTQTLDLHYTPLPGVTALMTEVEPSTQFGNTSIEEFRTDPPYTVTIKYIKPSGIPTPPTKVKIRYQAENASLASQYYLSYNEGGYSEPISGCTIDIAKEMLLKDAGVRECTEPGVPLPSLNVGDKYIDLVFQLANGQEKHAYIPCKDLFDPYNGEKAIRIEYDTADHKNYIRLILHDPENLEALVQTENGLRIMKGSITQSGVVKLAGEALATIAADEETAMTPADVLTFIRKSRAPGYQGFNEF